MKPTLPLLFSVGLFAAPASAADDPDLARMLADHQEQSRELADQQDELAADVQQLTIEQTDPRVIDHFRQVEDIMDEAAELLFEHRTDGPTIAAETEVIEKIYDAAKQRQQSSGGESQAGGAMMDMLERMLGREPGQQPGPPQGKPGDQGGEGMTGDSDSPNERIPGAADGAVGERRVPKGSGTSGRTLPSEFRPALDAYNRAAGKLSR